MEAFTQESSVTSDNNVLESDKVTMKEDDDGGGAGSEVKEGMQDEQESADLEIQANDAPVELDDRLMKDSDIDSVNTKTACFHTGFSMEEESVISDREAEASSKLTGEGSDSGVEINGCSSCGGRDLLRTFICNSGGYASSCGGADDSLTTSTATPAASCDSSLISCYSTYEDTEEIVSSSMATMLQVDGDGTSEGSSESSSITSRDARARNGATKKVPSSSNRVSVKKRSSAVEEPKTSSGSPNSKSKNASPTATPINSFRSKAIMSHSASGASKSTLNVAERSNPLSKREKGSSTLTAIRHSAYKPSSTGSTKSSSSSSSKSLCCTVGGAPKTRPKDGSMSSSVESRKDCSSGTGSGTVKGRGTRTSSVRSKFIGGTDDGRWPSTNKSNPFTPRARGGSVVEGQSRKLNLNSSSVASSSLMESKASALEKYATLPRRRRCKSPEVSVTVETHFRSHSISRDPSLNRAASLRKQHRLRESSSLSKSLPPYPRRRFQAKTIIYNETSTQTALTAEDVENALAGVPVREIDPLDALETHEQEIQVDRRMEEVEHLELQLKLLSDDYTRLKADSEQQNDELASKEKELEQEKAEKLATREELHQRLLAILKSVKSDHLEEHDSTDTLQALETYLHSSSHVVIKQQQEISELQTLCQTLKRDLEKSLAAQKTLLQQQQDLEAESMEMQEFLQAEKSTLAEALKDAETEIKGQRLELIQKELEVERQQEECKHLVRISEQRSQENLAIRAQLCNLEQRSRELLLQQGAAVSGAAVALSSLSSRLDGLVEQLVVSYNISEKDLEDVIFHNEAYIRSNSSIEGSPEKVSANKQSESSSSEAQLTQSPKRGASFVSAVINAIQSATVGTTTKQLEIQNEEIAEVTDSVLEDTMPVVEHEQSESSGQEEDTVSHGRYSTGNILANSESLQNLSQAILNRQQFELAQAEGSGDITAECEAKFIPALEDCSPVVTLVDQIIDVDNLVTKLLKVLRIIQLENDTCVDELHDERMQLADQVRSEQERRRQMQDEVRNWECIGARLQGEIQDVRLQLQRRVQEVQQTKTELEQHKNQIEELTRELNNLSAVCKETEMQMRTHEQEAENVLEEWRQSGQLPCSEILARVITARDEIPVLKKKLAEKEHQLHEIGQKYSLSKQVLTENWHQAATEVRRQYEAIDSALETLNSVQGVVLQCPPLAKLQQDLEETNFQSASSMPLIAADLNANAPPLVTLNGTSNGGNNTSHNSGKTINGTA